MPGQDGTELIRELLGEYSLNQMVVITAHPDIKEVATLLELGPITLLSKPLVVAQLIECVERMTGTQLVGGPANGRVANRSAEGSSYRMPQPIPLKPEPPLPDEFAGHQNDLLSQKE
jgi:DNA-binding NarL/FixJ family response regulator